MTSQQIKLWRYWVYVTGASSSNVIVSVWPPVQREDTGHLQTVYEESQYNKKMETCVAQTYKLWKVESLKRARIRRSWVRILYWFSLTVLRPASFSSRMTRNDIPHLLTTAVTVIAIFTLKSLNMKLGHSNFGILITTSVLLDKDLNLHVISILRVRPWRRCTSVIWVHTSVVCMPSAPYIVKAAPPPRSMVKRCTCRTS